MEKNLPGQSHRSWLEKHGHAALGLCLVIPTLTTAHLRIYDKSEVMLLDISVNICPRVVVAYPQYLMGLIGRPSQLIGEQWIEPQGRGLAMHKLCFEEMEHSGVLRGYSLEEWNILYNSALSHFIKPGSLDSAKVMRVKEPGGYTSGWADSLAQLTMTPSIPSYKLL